MPADKPNLADWLLALFVFLLVLLETTDYYRLSTYYAAVVMVVVLMRQRFYHVVKLPEFWFLLGLSFWVYATASWCEFSEVAVPAAQYRLRVYVLGVLILAQIRSPAAVRLCLLLQVVGALFLAAPTAILGYSAVTEGGARSAGFSEENMINRYAAILSDSFLVSLVLLQFYGRRVRRLVYLYWLVGGIAVLATGSRGAALAVCCGVAAYLGFEYLSGGARRNLQAFLVALVVTAAVLVIAAYVFRASPLVQRVTDSANFALDEKRLYMYQRGWELFQDQPLIGNGPATFSYYTGGEFFYTHSTYVELLVSGGIVLFVLYYGFVGCIAVTVNRLAPYCAGNERLRRCMNACRALLIASVVHGAVRVMISERMSITTLCLIAALAHVLRERLAAGSGGLASSNEQVVSGTG